MSQFPNNSQIRRIVTTALYDTVVNDEITENDIYEVASDVARQITRWGHDVNPTPGSTSHHILDTLAGNGTPTHVDQLVTASTQLITIAPVLDTLVIAGYVESHPQGYTITAHGLRALGAAPVPEHYNYNTIEESSHRRILKALHEAKHPLTILELDNAVEVITPAGIERYLASLMERGHVSKVNTPGATTYTLTDAGHEITRNL